MTDGPAIEIPQIDQNPQSAIAYARRGLFPMTLSQKPNVRQQAEVFLSDARFMTTPIPIVNGHLDFFGDIQLENSPFGATYATPLSADSLLVQGKHDQPLGVVYFARPEDQREALSTRRLRMFPIRRDLTYIELKHDGVLNPDIFEYYTDYPTFIQELTTKGKLDIAPQTAPRTSLFYAWRYLRDHPEQKDRVYDFLQRKGLPALTTFLTTHGNLSYQSDLMQFFFPEADVPGRGFADQILDWLADVNSSAIRVASRAVSPTVHWAIPLYEKILELPRRLVCEAADLENAYRNNPSPTHSQKAQQRHYRADILRAAEYFKGYLDLLSNPDDFGRTITLKDLAHFQQYHDPSDPKSSSIFDAVARYFFRLWGKRQQKFAPYADRVREITQQFYDLLPQLEDNASLLTADTELNNRQIRTIAQHLHDAGLLPAMEISVRSDGIRSGRRIDEPFYTFLRDALGYKLIEYRGNDLVQHPDLPSFITFHQGDSATAMRIFRDHFHIALTEWPGPPVDTLILTDVLEYFTSIASTLQPRGIYILDLPLPYGVHSYATNITAVQMSDASRAQATGVPRHEPPGIIERSFSTPSGGDVTKPFLILDLESLVHSAREAGLELLNVTPDPSQRKRLVDAITADDDILSASGDCLQHAFYRTGGEYNRARLVFVRATPEEATDLRSKIGAITSPASYGLSDQTRG